MRRALGFCLVTLSLAVPGAAQAPGQRLHRFIPGDMALGELPPGVLATPASVDDVRNAARASGWTDSQRQNPPDEVLRPRNNWESVSRTMDAQTRSPAGASLRYHEVFTPSIAPFKRAHAFDAVDELGRLVVRDPSLRPVRVGEVPAAWSRETTARFTGDVYLELSDAAPTAVPSVAAEEAIVSFRTEPEVPVAFFRDSAGNLFVRAESTRTVRLLYVVEAPQHAFVTPAGSIPWGPAGTTSFHGVAPAPSAPPFIVSASRRVLDRVGVRRDEPFRRVLDALVGYFRGFRDDDLPTQPGDPELYARLALGGVGACRHRAYAFVLTLHALGVPARYVGNEAHAWAEVAVPGVGWSRVDLGGWDVNLQNDSDRAGFVPANPDPFPRPESYTNGYSTYTANERRNGRHERDAGAPQQGPGGEDPGAQAAAQPAAQQGDGGVAEQGSPGAPGAAANGGGAPGNGPGAATGGGPGGRAGASGAAASGASGAESRERPQVGRPTPSDDPDPAEAEREMHPTTLRLVAVRAVGASAGRAAVRGTLVSCSGEAHDETGAPVADLPIVLELVQGHHAVAIVRGGHRESALGTTVTDPDGRFSASVLLPLELEAGDYAIRVQTPGDARHAPARGE